MTKVQHREPSVDDIAAAIQEGNDVLTGAGIHAGHKRSEVDGGYVECSCGARVQGRLFR